MEHKALMLTSVSVGSVLVAEGSACNVHVITCTYLTLRAILWSNLTLKTN